MIKVLLADDSAFLRQILKASLEKQGKILVVGQAKNGKEAVEMVRELKPDLMILDCEMPVMNGLEALRRIMEATPLPVLMFSSLTREGASVTIKALEYGAVDFLLKPTSLGNGLEEIEKVLVRKIEMAVIRGKFGALKGPGRASAAVSAASAPALSTRKIDLVAVGSSTGGVQAAMQVVPNLPAGCPPVVWVQHMPEHFTKSFAERLAGASKIHVKEAEDGDVLKRGHMYLARGGVQMRVAKSGLQMCVRLGETDKVSGFCPSANVLFESVSMQYGENALGVILTGMGNDGTEGLKLMRRKGSFILGQDEATCVVYGMPKAAHDAGAVNVQLSLYQIAPAIEKICGAAVAA